MLGRRTDPFPLRKLYFMALRAPDVKSHIRIARKMITFSVILAQFTDMEEDQSPGFFKLSRSLQESTEIKRAKSLVLTKHVECLQPGFEYFNYRDEITLESCDD